MFFYNSKICYDILFQKLIKILILYYYNLSLLLCEKYFYQKFILCQYNLMLCIL